MTAVGGSIESVSLNGRPFAATADAEANRKLGGFENEVSPNGDGTARMVKTRVAWALDGIVLTYDDSEGDQEFVQEIADGNGWVPIDVTLASGLTYSGTGTVSGEVQGSSQNASGSVTLSGPGKLAKQ